MHKKLFIPGPTEVREDILKAQTAYMIGHRSSEFSDLYVGIVNKLKKALNTKNYAMVFTSSGTGLMEGAIRNCVDKKVLCCTNGAFSERWAKIAQACDKEVDTISLEWGKAIKPEMIEEKLKTGKYEAMTLVHNETSTGVRAPIEEIAEVMKRYPDVLWLVDTVSSLMGDRIEIDKLGIDVCLSSSQKCFALPPGLAVITLTERVFEKAKTVKGRGYYFDFITMRKYFDERKQTTTTPGISLMQAMDRQLDRILEEGMENRYKRHLDMAEYTRDWARRYFDLFAEKGYESVTVTTIKNTRNISVKDLIGELGKRGFSISNGYGKLKEQTFRIAHMGDLTLTELKELIENINEILGLK